MTGYSIEYLIGCLTDHGTQHLSKSTSKYLDLFICNYFSLFSMKVSSAGDLYVLKGSGSFSPEEASFVVLIALGDKVSVATSLALPCNR